MKAKRILVSASIVFLLCLTACSVHIVDLTPEEFPLSPVNTYTFQAKVDVSKKTAISDSFEAFVVIDGKQFPMSRRPSGNHRRPNNYLFEYEYQPNQEISAVQFYYILKYLVKKRNEAPASKQVVSDFYLTQLPKPNAPRLNRKRAAVDEQVILYGDQFTEQDRVLINGTPCETNFISSKELQFLVPEIKPSFGYTVEVFTSKGMLEAGILRVDAAHPLQVLPKKIELEPGQSKALVFMLNYPAPYGGLYLDVKTDIPNSIIMPKVFIPERSRTVSITVEGTQTGKGNLFIKAGALPEIIVPVMIR